MILGSNSPHLLSSLEDITLSTEIRENSHSSSVDIPLSNILSPQVNILVKDLRELQSAECKSFLFHLDFLSGASNQHLSRP